MNAADRLEEIRGRHERGRIIPLNGLSDADRITVSEVLYECDHDRAALLTIGDDLTAKLAERDARYKDLLEAVDEMAEWLWHDTDCLCYTDSDLHKCECGYDRLRAAREKFDDQ